MKVIDSSDLVVALLDGSVDVDSGIAAEIGYAFARGKLVHALRTDFRMVADNLGSRINLQVEYFIRASGGDIHGDLPTLIEQLVKVEKK